VATELVLVGDMLVPATSYFRHDSVKVTVSHAGSSVAPISTVTRTLTHESSVLFLFFFFLGAKSLNILAHHTFKYHFLTKMTLHFIKLNIYAFDPLEKLTSKYLTYS